MTSRRLFSSSLASEQGVEAASTGASPVAEMRVMRGDSTEYRDLVNQISRDSFQASFHCQATQIAPAPKSDKKKKGSKKAVTVNSTDAETTPKKTKGDALDDAVADESSTPRRYKTLYNKWMSVVPLIATMTVRALTGQKSNATKSAIVKTPVKGGPTGSVVLTRGMVVELDSKARAMVDNWPLIKRTFEEGFEHPCLTRNRSAVSGGRSSVWKFYLAVLIRGRTFLIEQKWVLESKTSNDDLFVRVIAFDENHFQADVVEQINARMAQLGFS